MKMSKSRSVELDINPLCFMLTSKTQEHWKFCVVHDGAIIGLVEESNSSNFRPLVSYSKLLALLFLFCKCLSWNISARSIIILLLNLDQDCPTSTPQYLPLKITNFCTGSPMLYAISPCVLNFIILINFTTTFLTLAQLRELSILYTKGKSSLEEK